MSKRNDFFVVSIYKNSLLPGSGDYVLDAYNPALAPAREAYLEVAEKAYSQRDLYIRDRYASNTLDYAKVYFNPAMRPVLQPLLDEYMAQVDTGKARYDEYWAKVREWEALATAQFGVSFGSTDASVWSYENQKLVATYAEVRDRLQPRLTKMFPFLHRNGRGFYYADKKGGCLFYSYSVEVDAEQVGRLRKNFRERGLETSHELGQLSVYLPEVGAPEPTRKLKMDGWKLTW